MNTPAPTERSSKTTTFTEGIEEPTVATQEKPLHHYKRYKQNWRINLLSMPKKPRSKYTSPPDVFESGVAPGALKVETPERVEHMSRPTIRSLVVNKKQFTPLHKDYDTRMDKRIELAWNSIYNEYKKARRDLSRKSSAASRRSRGSRGRRYRGAYEQPAQETKPAKGEKHGKGKGDMKKEKGEKGKKGKKEKKGAEDRRDVEKTEEDLDKEFEEWLELRAKPKRVFLPEPIARGPIADLLELKEKMDTLATPKKVYPFEEKDPTVIPEAALSYVPTDRILELARPPPFRLAKEEPIIPGVVKPEALTAIATERIKQLATPKVAQSAGDVDVKEDPFAISPNALKYVATERIKELAKPIER
ncbi:hypothetical protein Trydic_g11313 [Trypoxylus dichotomus]